MEGNAVNPDGLRISRGAEDGVAIMGEDNLRGKIHEVRGQKVMLDFELAEIYGYSTKAFNQQVKNNIEKFDSDFRFQITAEEWENLRSKKLTSSWGGSRYLPYAFSESGIYMLMTVLKGDLATRQSKALIRLFKQMKDAVEEGRGLVSRREFLDLSLKLNDSLSEGLRLRRDLGKVEDDVAQILDAMDGFVRESEIGAFVEDFGKAAERRGYLIMDGQLVEAAAAYAEVYASARRTVFVVDNYVDARTLEQLSAAREGLAVTLFTDNRGHRLRAADVGSFRKEFPEIALDVRSAGGFVHDRLVALDYGTPDEAVYHCGSSSKDAGKRATNIARLESPEMYRPIFERLLAQPELELP
ncbi:MAG: ORF6N domain-containing protein [Eggerthellaceae bacterium]|nr:ORF6N domain-containing protein [Eggerthellaceae bacterium]